MLLGKILLICFIAIFFTMSGFLMIQKKPSTKNSSKEEAQSFSTPSEHISIIINQTEDKIIENNQEENESSTPTTFHQSLEEILESHLKDETSAQPLQDITNHPIQMLTKSQTASPATPIHMSLQNSFIKTSPKKPSTDAQKKEIFSTLPLEVRDLIVNIKNIIQSIVITNNSNMYDFSTTKRKLFFTSHHEDGVENNQQPLLAEAHEIEQLNQTQNIDKRSSLEKTLKWITHTNNFFEIEKSFYQEIPQQIIHSSMSHVPTTMDSSQRSLPPEYRLDPRLIHSPATIQFQVSLMQQAIRFIPAMKNIFESQEHIEFRGLDILNSDLNSAIELAFRIIYHLYINENNKQLFHQFAAELRNCNNGPHESIAHISLFDPNNPHTLNTEAVQTAVKRLFISHHTLAEQINSTFASITNLNNLNEGNSSQRIRPSTNLNLAKIRKTLKRFTDDCSEFFKILEFSLTATNDQAQHSKQNVNSSNKRKLQQNLSGSNSSKKMRIQEESPLSLEKASPNILTPRKNNNKNCTPQNPNSSDDYTSQLMHNFPKTPPSKTKKENSPLGLVSQ